VSTPATPGRIVLLNGPSSAGKTSLSHAVVELLDTPWFEFPGDLLHSIRSRPDLRGVDDIDWEATFRRTRAGYHRAIAGLARAGCDVIADHVLNEPWRLADLLEVTRGVDVLLVHVTCAPDVLVQRERERADREPGAALQQLGLVFAHDDCDLVVDTSEGSVEQSAQRVSELIATPPSDRAFDRLRTQLDAG
jgi:chloramphenicol 3-O phosphotransferase